MWKRRQNVGGGGVVREGSLQNVKVVKHFLICKATLSFLMTHFPLVELLKLEIKAIYLYTE